MSRYMCSRHGVEMVLRVWIVKYRDGCKPFEYWACPVNDCDYVKPQKYQAHLVKRKNHKRSTVDKRSTVAADERQGTLF